MHQGVTAAQEKGREEEKEEGRTRRGRNTRSDVPVTNRRPQIPPRLRVRPTHRAGSPRPLARRGQLCPRSPAHTTASHTAAGPQRASTADGTQTPRARHAFRTYALSPTRSGGCSIHVDMGCTGAEAWRVAAYVQRHGRGTASPRAVPVVSRSPSSGRSANTPRSDGLCMRVQEVLLGY